MILSRFATQHIKAILFVTVALCCVGIWLLGDFPVSILPDVTFPRAVVIAEAGERPARMMEVAVTRPLEEAIAVVPGVTRIKSKTQRGASELSVDFVWGTDMLVAQQLVNARVGEVRSQLPPETRVSVERMNPTIFPILGISLRNPKMTQAELWSLATYTIRPRLARVPGMSRVVVQGGRVPEIAVEVIPARLAAFRLSLPEVHQAIAQSNTVRAVGRLEFGFKQYQALISAEKADASQLGNVVITQRGGIPIYLRQIAVIHPSVEDPTTAVTAEGVESVLVTVSRQPEANTVAVVEAARREIEAIKPVLPAGTMIGTWYDQSNLIRAAVTSVRDAVLIGAVLAVFVLLLFLGNLRATLVTAAIIPATIFITFLLMRLSGLTLNLMTLGALAVGIGLVIDDAIVVVENVFRHLARGEERTVAVQTAAAEIAAPMISSTLTTVVVFLPLALVAGVAGAFFLALAITLTIALLVSLALALLVSPSMCAAFLQIRAENGQEHGRLFERAIGTYESLLRIGLSRRWLTPLTAAAAIAVTVLLGTRLESGFMPEMDEGAFVLDFWTPPGTSLTETNRLLGQIEKILTDTPEVAAYSRRAGAEMGFFVTEQNRGDMAITLREQRSRGVDVIIDEIRGKIARQVPGVKIEFVQVLQDIIGDLAGNPEPVEIKLFGEDLPRIEELSRTIAEKMEKIAGVVDVKSGIVESGPELVARIDQARAGRAGLTPDMVADQVNAAMFGNVATQLLQGDRQIGVRVRYPAAFRTDPAQISALPIRSPIGFNLPLGAIAGIEPVPGTTERNREDQRRLVSVTGRLSGARDLGSVTREVNAMLKGVAMPPGVSYLLGGYAKSQAESFRNLLSVFALAVILVFAVMLFPFGSFTSPVVIMLIMPLSLFGVVVGLWITGTPLNVSSFMGAIMLVGIVVKNGILLLDRAQKAVMEGSPVEEAVIQAGRVRLRPILMTTLTAILGLVPLAFGIGPGAQMQKPLAVAVIGGLTFSTLFTLMLAPMLYVSMRRWQIARQTRRAAIKNPK